jgi:predicted DNA-binding ribbon-helix-helix protein
VMGVLRRQPVTVLQLNLVLIDKHTSHLILTRTKSVSITGTIKSIEMTRQQAERAAEIAYSTLVNTPSTVQEIADGYNKREALTRKLMKHEDSRL